MENWRWNPKQKTRIYSMGLCKCVGPTHYGPQQNTCNTSKHFVLPVFQEHGNELHCAVLVLYLTTQGINMLPLKCSSDGWTACESPLTPRCQHWGGGCIQHFLYFPKATVTRTPISYNWWLAVDLFLFFPQRLYPPSWHNYLCHFLFL